MATESEELSATASPPAVEHGRSVSLPLRPKNSNQETLNHPSDERVNFDPSAQPADLSLEEAREDAKPNTDTETQPRVKFAGINKADAPQQESSATQEFGADDAGVDGENADVTAEDKKKKKRKKKKNKPASKRGANAPSGFEEYYVDPPVTPAEFTLEEELYANNKPFSERIEIAFQRFISKRKMDPFRRNMWIKYLQFGGIKTGQKQFNGGPIEQDDELSAADIITLRATEHVQREIVDEEEAMMEDADHDPKFVVDFNGVTQAFLSLYIRSYFDVTTPEAVKAYCGLIRNWLNYLLHHNVCNEYEDDIRAARKTCDLAESELTKMTDLPGLLPGTFGSACKTLYVDPEAFQGLTFAWQSQGLEGLSKDQAGRIFLTALASMGSDEMVDRYQEQNEEQLTKIANSVDTGLEVTGIFPPTKQVRDMYNHPSNHNLTPMGHMTARTWWCPWAGDEDLTEEEEAALPAKRAAETRDYTLWMDEETLKHLAIGMKMTVDLKELSFGIWFMDTAKLIFPSYSMTLPNELIEGWREHEYIPPKKEGDEATLNIEANGEPTTGESKDALNSKEPEDPSKNAVTEHGDSAPTAEGNATVVDEADIGDGIPAAPTNAGAESSGADDDKLSATSTETLKADTG